MMFSATLCGLAALFLPQAPGAEQDEVAAARLADLASYNRWLADYERGAMRLVRDGQTDAAAVAAVDATLGKVAAWGTIDAARELFKAAVTDPPVPGASSPSARIEYHAELLPWTVRELARGHIAKIADPAVEAWLIGLLHDRALKSLEGTAERRSADAALQILGRRPSAAGQQAVLEASRRLPPNLRVRALDVLAQSADISLVPHFIEILRDKEANVRIAALNALGNALQPHTDETERAEIEAAVAAKRDAALGAIEQILERDKVWQVRAAATNAVLAMRTKFAIPVLIAGLDAELGRKQDPWAMDVRLHRALERMTGQVVPLGESRAWKTFWKAEQDRFQLVKADEANARRAASKEGDRYEKFFAMDLTSDRLLFVLDFSGSMEELITLDTETTSTKPGETKQKAKLVVEEIKKIILSLPDGAVFNIIVFNDDVRIWRPDDRGRPRAVALDDATRDDLLGTFLDSLSPQGPTNLYGAMDAALGFDTPGVVSDKRYGPGFDTIYILSDGAPTFGEITDKVEIRKRVRAANRLSQLTIHSITFGELNDVDFLRELAEENGGRHIHVQ